MADTANPRYCPTDWLDEVCPLADTPEGFARRVGDNWLLIDPDEETDAETYCKSDLEAGQIVSFARLIKHDDFTLTVHDDGSHSADHPDFPEGHTGFRLPDWEWGDSVEALSELVRLGEDGISNEALQPGTYTVECSTWQDDISFRFEPQDEVPKFVLSAGAN